ncbi:MAG: hypothetical protein R3C01_08625 [Planctomycetaceae bacterium]
MRGSGGTEGGVGQFLAGMILSIIGVYLFFDSVIVQTDPTGLITGGARRMMGEGRMGQTTSMGIVFVPFFIAVVYLFVDAKKRWAWYLLYVGLVVLAIEILSRVRFTMNTKLSLLLLIFVLIAAGAGLMIRSYREQPRS